MDVGQGMRVCSVLAWNCGTGPHLATESSSCPEVQQKKEERSQSSRSLPKGPNLRKKGQESVWAAWGLSKSACVHTIPPEARALNPAVGPSKSVGAQPCAGHGHIHSWSEMHFTTL